MSKSEEQGEYKRIIVEVGVEPNAIPKGLKSKFVKSLLLTHSIPLFGRVTRERDSEVLVIKIIIGNPNIKITNWSIIMGILKNIFEPCRITRIDTKNIEIPKADSVFRKLLFVGETTIEARRTGLSIASSGTEDVGVINATAKQRTELEKWGSSSIHTLLTGFSNDNVDVDDNVEDIDIGESVSQVRQRKSKSSLTLQRASGTIQIGSHKPLDKIDCTEWPEDAFKQLLVTTVSKGGVGIPEKALEGITVYGIHFENIIDALIDFIGDKEAKITYACGELGLPKSKEYIKKAIVRWVYKNLLEKSKS